jgi:putative hemolysin
VLLSGILAGAESAIVALRKTRLTHLMQTRKGGARAVMKLRDDPERFLATVQIGTTLLSAAAGAFAGITFAPRLAPFIARLPGLAPYAGSIAFIAAVSLIAYLSLVLSALIPKSLALRSPEWYALVVSRPLLALSFIARPFVWFLTASSNLVLRLFGDRTTFTEARLSSEELQELVSEAAKIGSIDPGAGEIASRAFDFAQLTAGHVMVPRAHVIGIPRHARMNEVQRVVLEEGHTRMPVYEGTIDNVVGYVMVPDMIALVWERQLFVLEDLIRPAFFVTESMRAVDLLHEMRQKRLQLAVVVDERGAMQGIITMEDLLEELVGEIFSEDEEAAPETIRRETGGSAVVQGGVPLRDVNRELALDLPEAEGRSTIAGLCLELAGRIPRAGERFTTDDGTTLEIVEASLRQVRTVRVSPPADAAAEHEL